MNLHGRSRRDGLEKLGKCPKFSHTDRRPTNIDFDNRRRDAIDLRHQGLTNQRIGRELHADPSWNTSERWAGIGYPGGYGWRLYWRGEPPLSGHRLDEAVSKDIARAGFRARLALESVRQELLALHVERLNVAAAALWEGVLDGSPRAQEVWLGNMRDQAQLLGLTTPAAQTTVNVLNVGQDGDRQPDWNPEFATRMFEALREVGAILPGDPDPVAMLGIGNGVDSGVIDADVIDADVVE